MYVGHCVKVMSQSIFFMCGGEGGTLQGSALYECICHQGSVGKYADDTTLVCLGPNTVVAVRVICHLLKHFFIIRPLNGENLLPSDIKAHVQLVSFKLK